MPTESLLAIQAELAQLRAVLIIISVIGGVFLVLGIVRQLAGIYREIPRMMSDSFKTDAEDLLEQNKLSDLKTRMLERLESHPNFDYAHWYLARALYLEGDDDAALREFAILKKLSPSWNASHIDPYVKTIHERRNAAKSADC
jgi:hypothetical protein